MENKQFDGQLAVITGASSGIGYELAKQFAQNGFDLLVCAEDDGITEAAQAFRSFGHNVQHLKVDLAEYEGVEKLVSAIESAGKPIEVIAINAGVGVGGATFDKTDLDQELNLLRLNVLSVVHLSEKVLALMLRQGHGRMLFTSSVAAFMPGPFEAVYAASKAFVQSFAEAIRHENADKGIIVTALQPGPTETNFFHRAGMDDTKVGESEKDDPAQVARQGYDALMNGEHAVVAGSVMNKVQANLARVAPQKVSAKMHENMTRPNDPAKR